MKVSIIVLRCGFRVYEVPISNSGRDYSEGKKINGQIFLIFCGG